MSFLVMDVLPSESKNPCTCALRMKSTSQRVYQKRAEMVKRQLVKTETTATPITMMGVIPPASLRVGILALKMLITVPHEQTYVEMVS